MTTRNVLVECDSCGKVYEVKSTNRPVPGMVYAAWESRADLPSASHCGSADLCRDAKCITEWCTARMTQETEPTRPIRITLERPPLFSHQGQS